MAYLEEIPKYAFGTAYAIAEVAVPAGAAERECSNIPDSGGGGGCGCDADGSATPVDSPSPSERGESQDDYLTTPTTTTTTTTTTTRAGNTFTADQIKQLVAEAIRLGCRHFDCAPLYGTQPLVGEVMRETVKRVPRQQFFFTSKVPPNMMRPANLERSVKKSIEELQVNYLDLVLLHAPFSTKHLRDDLFYPVDQHGELLLDDINQDEQDQDRPDVEGESLLAVAWRKLVDLKRRGLTRFIGLSNVNLEQLIRMQQIHQVDVVQNEYHIYNQNREIFDHCEEIDVHFEAYAAFGSPLEARRYQRPCCLSDPMVKRVARNNRLSIAEVIVQWIHQQPLSYVIRCDTRAQLQENLKAIRSQRLLPINDLIDLDTLNRNVRIYYFDEHKGVEKHREYPFKRQPAAAAAVAAPMAVAAAVDGAQQQQQQLQQHPPAPTVPPPATSAGNKREQHQGAGDDTRDLVGIGVST